jgi:hypothetical protein
VRLVEVDAKGYHQHLGRVGPKERLEASTVAEVVVSQGAPSLIMEPHLVYARGNRRDAQWCWDPARRMYCLSDRHVRPPPVNHSWAMTVTQIYVSTAVAALPSSCSVTFRERTGWE